MPSRALGIWDGERVPRLALLERQCESGAAHPLLLQENLRALVVSLSAHFQGFCRDLYSEAAQVIASKVRTSLQAVVQDQFTTGLKLDRGNATLPNVVEDFRRLGFEVKKELHESLADEPEWHLRLHQLNEWRNAVAHQLKDPTAPILDSKALRLWRENGDRIVHALDRIAYDGLAKLLRRKPWPR